MEVDRTNACQMHVLGKARGAVTERQRSQKEEQVERLRAMVMLEKRNGV